MKEELSINVLYVDDEENNLIAFKASFRRYFNVFTALSADEAKVLLNRHEISILITDQRMPGTKLPSCWRTWLEYIQIKLEFY